MPVAAKRNVAPPILRWVVAAAIVISIIGAWMLVANTNRTLNNSSTATVQNYPSHLNFSLKNETDQHIIQLWAKDHSSSFWGEPLSNFFVAAAGGFRTIEPNESLPCILDISIKFSGGEEYRFDNLNLCQISKITIAVEDGRVVYRFH
jgi:hypothetical protein